MRTPELTRIAPLTLAPWLRAGSVALLLCACSGGGGGGGFSGVDGQELAKPGGGTFFLDPHEGGGASRVRLVEIFWGRLVDVHQIDGSGAPDPTPVFRDFVVREDVQSDSANYRLETNPVTQRTRLTILRSKGAPDSGSGTFESLLRAAAAGLAPVLPKDDDGSSSGPFSLVARNACLQLRFNDLLEDGAEARTALADAVKVVEGYPPRAPFSARTIFDQNHGGISGAEFHATRMLIDLTVSEQEQGSSEVPLVVNALGLPASELRQSAPNVSIRIPTRRDPASGQFVLLTNLSGSELDPVANGPMDLGAPTRDVVRALRSGREDDANNGFLLDLNRPELIGAWPLRLEDARPLPGGSAGVDFLADLAFDGACRGELAPPGIVQSGELFLEVTLPSGAPDAVGVVRDVHLRSLGDELVENAAALLGEGLYLSPYDPSVPVAVACWINFLPRPQAPPAAGVSSQSQVQVRFSEPMDPTSLDPFDTVRVVRGNSSVQILPSNLVIARIQGSTDLREFTLTPLLPLSAGSGGEYHLELAGGPQGATDLAGNALVSALLPVDFSLDPLEPVSVNGGVALRFSGIDELEPLGATDVRGQIFYDLARGTIRPRGLMFESFPADRSQPVPSIMIPFPPGVQTPLSPLGSKLQTVWRYCDLGWQVADESKHNLDVVGLAWSPAADQVVSDFFERFEIRLSHSNRLPDETRTFLGTTYGCSGLLAGRTVCPPCTTGHLFEENILLDPLSPQKVVHERSLGYRIDPSDLFVGATGTPFMPYPMNRQGGPFVTYTWRDTAVLALGGNDSPGIPLAIEVLPPLSLEFGPAGRIAPPGNVPSYGLPLLIEVRCFPSDTGIGLNPVDISLAQNAQPLPNLRAFSTGGLNTARVPVLVNPDLELIPNGGFNPNSRPPGQPTVLDSDNSFYIGNLDTVVRVSRAHTIWIDTALEDPVYLPPILSPLPGDQPARTQVLVEFRGAEEFLDEAQTQAFDAAALDPYGDPESGDVVYLQDDPTWKGDIGDVDGARYLQLRFTFVNDLQSGLSPELSAVGIAFALP